jgi:hypothetical protein
MSVVLRLTLRADDPETCRLVARLVRRAAGRGRARRRPAGRRGVVLVPTDGLGGLLRSVGPRLAAADPELFGDLQVGPEVKGAVPEGPGAVLPPREEAALLDAAARACPEAGVRVVFTPHRLHDNWFSHWDGDRRSALVSMADWDGRFSVPPRAFVAYQAVLHGLRLLGTGYDPEGLAHLETRGCLFDFCRNRPDVEIKLQAGDFCPSCAAAMTAAGLPVRRLLRLARVIRRLAGTLVSAR